MSKKSEKATKVETPATEAKATRAPRKSLSDSAILRVVSKDTKSQCSLDVIAAIETLGDKATVAAVIAATCETHVAPRSLIAKAEPTRPGFVRGYVTHLVRTGLVVAK